MWITSSLATAITPTAIALGNFDGIHLGHQAVIRQVLPSPSLHPEEPSNLIPPLQGLSLRTDLSIASEGLSDLVRATGPIPTVMTFYPHPQEFFSGQTLRLLTPLPEKASQISRLGIGQLVLLPFNQALADLSPEVFVETLLVGHLQAQRISVGQDFCFGKNRQGSVTQLRELAQAHGVRVDIAPLACLGTERISSSRIRSALSQGDLATAQALLGRPYRLTGRVVKGQQLGRTLGFPTANLDLPGDKFLPAYGVYSVWVEGLNPSSPEALPGVMNLGLRPTVHGTHPTAEVHLLDWSGAEFYGQTLQVVLAHYLRPEQKFPSLEVLKHQIQEDCRQAWGQLSKTPPDPYA